MNVKTRRMMGQLTAVLLLLGFGGPSFAAPEGSSPGQTLPNFTLADQSGEKMSLEKIRNGHPALLFFFSPCCGHCKKELAQLIPFTKKLDGRGTAVIGVMWMGQSGMCQSRVTTEGWVGHVLADADGAVCARFGVGDFTVIALDRDGVVRYRGPADISALRNLEAF